MADFAARIGAVRYKFADGLTNALTGLGTAGDPRLANLYSFIPLSQGQIEAAYRGSGLMRKVIDIPAFDMVREWRDWQAEKAEIAKLEKLERKLRLPQKLILAEIMRGLGGGAMILGLPGDLAMPVNPQNPGKLAWVHTISRFALTAQEWIDDLNDPGFGGPKFWLALSGSKQVRIHPSRVVCFPGDPIPDLAGASDEDRFWGESKVQRVLDAVQNSDTAQAAFATLIHKARNTIIGIPGLLELTSTNEGETRLRSRIATLMRGESMFNATLRDAGDGKEGSGETIDHRQVTWAGIPDIIRVFAEAVSAAADIPMTRLWGKSAEGMNASGDSQQTDWNKMVKARQELLLRPCLEQIDAALIPTALGKVPPELWWQFSPLALPTEKEEAERFKTTAEAMKLVSDMAMIPDEAFAKAGQNTIVEGGWMPGLDGALADIPEDERYGIEQQEPPEAANENEVAAMQKRGAINGDQARALLTDARPRTLYVSRKLLNTDEFIAWAKGQGFTTTTPADELHVTICFSRAPVDWMKMGSAWDGDSDGKLTVKPGGARLVEKLGDKGAVVLMFASSELSWRHEDMKRGGASFDFDEYQPHVTITYQAPDGLDLEKVEPYRGKLVFGPEIFAEVVEDWEQEVIEA